MINTTSLTTQKTEIIIGKQFGPKVTPLIKTAKRSIDIIIFDWKWYPDQIGSEIQKFNNAIVDAIRRTKTVRAITNSGEILKRAEDIKIKVKNLPTSRLIHTKLIIIDNEIAILGSHNYTMYAFTINHEISVIIRDEPVIQRLTEYFNNLWPL